MLAIRNSPSVVAFILASKAQPGSVISVAPLLIACGDGAGNRHRQAGDGITMQGSQLAQTLAWCRFTLNSQPVRRPTPYPVLILVNGLVGNHPDRTLAAPEALEV